MKTTNNRPHTGAGAERQQSGSTPLSTTAVAGLDDPDAILTEAEAAQWLRLSVRTLQRGRIAGDGPEYLQLGKRRLGYRVGTLRAWINSRQRASTSAATVAAQEAAP
jgi:hypothetical protein